MKLIPRLKVEFENESYDFIPQENLILKLQKIGMKLTIKDGKLDTKDLPDEMIDIFVEIFDVCVDGWSGIFDEDENEVDCNKQNKSLFPSEIKIQVVAQYLEKRDEINKKK